MSTQSETEHHHPSSKWEEPWTGDRLTMFEKARPPRHIPDSDLTRRMTLPLKSLRDFQCPVCLGYLRKTSLVMECLHRFCAECIEKCLRLGKKQCPSCRIHIPSRRSLRPDKRYDELIRSILGDVDQVEEHSKLRSEQINRALFKSLNQVQQHRRQKRREDQKLKRKTSVASTVTEIEELSEEDGATPEPSEAETPVPLVTSTEPDLSLPRLQKVEETPLVEFFLQRHPAEHRLPRLNNEDIIMSGDATVGRLKTWLSCKLPGFESNHFEILLTSNKKPVLLDDHITLREIRHKISEVPLVEFMHLRYRIVKDALPVTLR